MNMNEDHGNDPISVNLGGWALLSSFAEHHPPTPLLPWVPAVREKTFYASFDRALASGKYHFYIHNKNVIINAFFTYFSNVDGRRISKNPSFRGTNGRIPR